LIWIYLCNRLNKCIVQMIQTRETMTAVAAIAVAAREAAES